MKLILFVPLAFVLIMCVSTKDEITVPQKITIKGKVVSSVDKKPISGVNILFNPIDTFFMGTISNINGDFIFVAEHADVIMKFNCQGYLNRQVACDGSKDMVVELDADEN